MRALLRRLGAFGPALLLLGTPAALSAQYFGRNKVEYDSFKFSVLKTERVVGHFLAERVRHIGHQDALRVHGFDVYIVVADVRAQQ